MKEEKKYVKRLKMILSNAWYYIAMVAITTIVIMAIVNWHGTFAIIGKLIKILMPFVLGFLFAYLMIPFVRMWTHLFDHIKPGQGLKGKKICGMIISYLIVVGVITSLVIFVAPQIVQSVKELARTVQKGYVFIKNNPDSFLDWMPFSNTLEVMEKIRDSINDIAINLGTKVFPTVYKISTSVVTVVYDIFFGLVISIYLTWSRRDMARTFRHFIYVLSPKKKSEEIWETLLDCNRIFNGFLLGKAVDSLIIGLLTFITMTIFGFEYSILFSVIVGITNMIPYFGPFLGAIPGVVIYLFIDPWESLWFAVMILIIQQLDGWLIGPKILGDQTGVKPLTVILGITIGGGFFGVWGMFLGVPAVAALQYLGKKFLDKKYMEKYHPDRIKANGGRGQDDILNDPRR